MKIDMRLALVLLLLSLFLALGVDSQILKAMMHLFPNIFFGPDGRGPRGERGGGGRGQRGPPTPFVDDGTREPGATGRDELFPADCGRNPHDGTGKMCFPDGLLCSYS